jgi:hypothetical protein
VITSPLLENLPWLEHGFGTRHAPLSQQGMASLKQIHSSLSLVADRPAGCVGEGDALLTAEPGIAVSVRTADCYPILLADTDHRAIAAVHAGWRGTDSQIVVETLRQMQARFGTQPADVIAAIGPGIGVCCYEVGADVARRFGMPGAGKLDLAQENLRQLTHSGVPARQVTIAGHCTFCDSSRFHSWRRDRDAAGRMISFALIRA